jgi:hypothetical protein
MMKTYYHHTKEDAPFTSRVNCVGETLGIVANGDQLGRIHTARNNFIDNLTNNIEERMENSNLVNHLLTLRSVIC